MSVRRVGFEFTTSARRRSRGSSSVPVGTVGGNEEVTTEFPQLILDLSSARSEYSGLLLDENIEDGEVISLNKIIGSRRKNSERGAEIVVDTLFSFYQHIKEDFNWLQRYSRNLFSRVPDEAKIGVLRLALKLGNLVLVDIWAEMLAQYLEGFPPARLKVIMHW